MWRSHVVYSIGRGIIWRSTHQSSYLPLINLTTIKNCSCGSNLSSSFFFIGNSTQIHYAAWLNSSPSSFSTPYSVISDSALPTEVRTQLDVDQKTKWLIEYLASRTTKHAKQQLSVQQPRSLLNKLKPYRRRWTCSTNFTFPWFLCWGLYMIIVLSVYISLAVSWLE